MNSGTTATRLHTTRLLGEAPEPLPSRPRRLPLPPDHLLRHVADDGDAGGPCIENDRGEPVAHLDQAALCASIAELGAGAESAASLLAVRGRYLALVTVPLESVVFAVVESTDSGRLSKVVVFDRGRLAEASRFLARRYLAYLPKRLARSFAVSVNWNDALVQRDLEAAEALIAPEFVMRDHRDGPVVTAERDTAVAGLRIILGDDLELIDLVTEIHRVTERGAVVSRTQVTGELLDLDGGDVTLVAVRDDAIAELGLYEPWQMDDAIARLESLSD